MMMDAVQLTRGSSRLAAERNARSAVVSARRAIWRHKMPS